MVRLENADVSEERIELGQGVSIPERWTVILRGEPGVPGVIRLQAVYDAVLARSVAAEVTVSREGCGDEVTSITLREVRVQSALQASGLRVSTVAAPGHAAESGGDYIRRMRARTERTVDENVTDAARTYLLASAINLPPLKAVSDGLGVSQSTATRLMARARTLGLAPAGLDFPDPSATGPVIGSRHPGGPSIG